MDGQTHAKGLADAARCNGRAAYDNGSLREGATAGPAATAAAAGNRQPMRVLGIETSCDETGVAVYDTACKGADGLLAQALYSQVALPRA